MSTRVKQKFGSKQEELESVMAQKRELEAKIRALKVDAREELESWESEAKAKLGEIILVRLGCDWMQVDPSALSDALLDLDMSNCIIAHNVGPLAGITRIRSLDIENMSKRSSEHPPSSPTTS